MVSAPEFNKKYQRAGVGDIIKAELNHKLMIIDDYESRIIIDLYKVCIAHRENKRKKKCDKRGSEE